ncbi:MAG: N-carbamoylputrescine amidase [Desulfobacteraceae bacterium]|jgi:N-carbamoylputrescine amidase
MRQLTVAAVQMACTSDRMANIAAAEERVREAAARGAGVVLLQELFETPYFCQAEKAVFFDLASEVDRNPAVLHFSRIARELEIVLPISFFERCNQAHYNSVAVIDADGTLLGVYRKTHIPDGPGYEEKFYFTPGDTGFRVWRTRHANVGVGICWDQWFPEAARAMALLGAEILCYPTAIGSEPADPAQDSKPHWQICMQGHAAANMLPVVAANRIGTESVEGSEISFYGSSFITNHRGEIVAEADRCSPAVLVETFDLDAIAAARRGWGLFRDRRPETYGLLMTSDGHLQK